MLILEVSYYNFDGKVGEYVLCSCWSLSHTPQPQIVKDCLLVSICVAEYKTRKPTHIPTTESSKSSNLHSMFALELSRFIFLQDGERCLFFFIFYYINLINTHTHTLTEVPSSYIK